MLLLGFLYGLGLVCFPIAYGILVPPENVPDTFGLSVKTLFWPALVVWYIFAVIADRGLWGLVAVGRELRAKCEAFYCLSEDVSRSRSHMTKEESTVKKIGEVYCHVGNSGATFSVIDDGFGPTILVTSASFGNLQTSFKLLTDRESMKAIGEMLINAATRSEDYSADYCHKGRILKNDNVGSSSEDKNEQAS